MALSDPTCQLIIAQHVHELDFHKVIQILHLTDKIVVSSTAKD
jgi:hypothetical protein